jgi:hypothetical protein
MARLKFVDPIAQAGFIGHWIGLVRRRCWVVRNSGCADNDLRLDSRKSASGHCGIVDGVGVHCGGFPGQ